MPKRASLELLTAAAARGDWKGASDAYQEIVVEVKESGEPFNLDALTWALRLHNADGVRAIVDGMRRLENNGHCADTAPEQ